MQLEGVTMQLEGVTMQLEGFTMQLEGVTMQLEGFTYLEACLVCLKRVETHEKVLQDGRGGSGRPCAHLREKRWVIWCVYTVCLRGL